MSDAPIHIVVAAFDSPDGASSMLKALEAARTVGLELFEDAAVLTRDRHGRLHIEESGDWGGGRGATVGGLVGAALGLLAGPVGWVAGLGAVIGGPAAQLRDNGFSDARLRTLGESLEPGTSVPVAVALPRWVPDLEQRLVEAGGVTLTEEVGADIASQLEAEHDGSRSAARRRRRPRPTSQAHYF
jgi:uncharacterized membrane protein